MYKKMLINAIHAEEQRVAIVDNKELLDLEIQSARGKSLKGSIYKAKIVRIEPSLQAAFVDIGASRNAFLQIGDVSTALYTQNSKRRPRIENILEPGQEIIAQVVKEQRENKGATLTTYISLPGRYLVVMPGRERGGVSRKIMTRADRERLSKLKESLKLPEGIGVIIRTAGKDRSLDELSRDFSIQMKIWEAVQEAAKSASAPSVLHKEGSLVTSVIRDYFTPDIREVIIDEQAAFQEAKTFVAQVMPRYRSRIRFHDNALPIFSQYEVEEQVVSALKPEIELPSGGSIIIQSLEALVAIDVNSGKATSGGSIEETAFRTNLEAADEAARQLRLRDLGGLVVIDFIDMWDRRHRAKVEERLRQAVRLDKAQVELGKISKFGLMEMSRQRIRSALSSLTHSGCQVCKGTGRLKNPEFLALEVLRKVQSAVISGHLKLVKLRMAPYPALFLLNNKREEIRQLESKYGVNIIVLGDHGLRSDDYEIELGQQQIESTRKTLAATTVTTESIQFRLRARAQLRGLIKDKLEKIAKFLKATRNAKKVESTKLEHEVNAKLTTK